MRLDNMCCKIWYMVRAAFVSLNKKKEMKD